MPDVRTVPAAPHEWDAAAWDAICTDAVSSAHRAASDAAPATAAELTVAVPAWVAADTLRPGSRHIDSSGGL